MAEPHCYTKMLPHGNTGESREHTFLRADEEFTREYERMMNEKGMVKVFSPGGRSYTWASKLMAHYVENPCSDAIEATFRKVSAPKISNDKQFKDRRIKD